MTVITSSMGVPEDRRDDIVGGLRRDEAGTGVTSATNTTLKSV